MSQCTWFFLSFRTIPNSPQSLAVLYYYNQLDWMTGYPSIWLYFRKERTFYSDHSSLYHFVSPTTCLSLRLSLPRFICSSVNPSVYKCALPSNGASLVSCFLVPLSANLSTCFTILLSYFLSDQSSLSVYSLFCLFVSVFAFMRVSLICHFMSVFAPTLVSDVDWSVCHSCWLSVNVYFSFNAGGN